LKFEENGQIVTFSIIGQNVVWTKRGLDKSLLFQLLDKTWGSAESESSSIDPIPISDRIARWNLGMENGIKCVKFFKLFILFLCLLYQFLNY
jgi:hypothetical protein